MEIKIGSLIVGLTALFLALFRFKDTDSKIIFFWISFTLLTQSFVHYFNNDLWLILVAFGTLIIGIIQGIRKRDKTYILLIGVMMALMIQVCFLLFFKRH